MSALISPFSRTFHPDEANQAFTVGRLLETGHYTYSPVDHHGPTLYYAAAPLQHAFGHDTTADLDGALLRVTPLLFALLGLLALGHALFMLLRAPDRRAGLVEAVLGAGMTVALLASAPLFVFFATNFIQEMLLVAFTLGLFWAGIGYARAVDAADPPRLKPGTWALFFGISAGLAFATKETSLLAFAALVPAALTLWFTRPGPLPVKRPHVILALLAFLLTAVILFSAGGRDWSAVYDAFVSAPLNYLGRGAGDAAVSAGADWHVHPWWQHLRWLVFGTAPGAHVRGFTHLFPLALVAAALIGLVRLRLRDRSTPFPLRARVFLALVAYTLTLTALYSAIPYKTPWCTLQLLVPLLVSTGLGLVLIRDTLSAQHQAPGTQHQAPGAKHQALGTLLGALVVTPLMIVGVEHAPGLVLMARDPDSSDIPYNYAHASPDVRALADCVATAVAQTPKDVEPFIAVALPTEDTWPFPWYNRKLEHLTGYWTSFDDLRALAETGAKPTVVIVPMTEGHLAQALFPHLTHTKRFSMRPRVRVRVFW